VDVVDYSAETGALTVNLAAGVATGAGTDSLSAVENTTGGSGDDRLIGDGLANALTGGAGNDVVVGGLGNDSMTGNAGTDTLDLSGSLEAVTVDLMVGLASGDGSDLVEGFERVVGSAFRDSLLGNVTAETLQGRHGADLLVGRGGTDRLVGGFGGDDLRGGPGPDMLLGESGNDSLNGGLGWDTCRGGLGINRVDRCES
jgi:Ca2+-binding RTX toxin-like protein